MWPAIRSWARGPPRNSSAPRKHAGEALVVAPHGRDVERLRRRSRPASPTLTHPAAVGQAAEAVLQGLAADRVDDDVGAVAVGEAAHLVGEVGLDVVDAVVEAELGRAARACRRCDAVASTVAPARLASWMAAMPTPLAAGLDQRGLARLQPTELEQAVVGGAERDGDAGGLLDGEPVGHRPAERLGHDPQLGVRAVEPDGDDPVALGQPGRPPAPTAMTVPAAW